MLIELKAAQREPDTEKRKRSMTKARKAPCPRRSPTEPSAPPPPPLPSPSTPSSLTPLLPPHPTSHHPIHPSRTAARPPHTPHHLRSHRRSASPHPSAPPAQTYRFVFRPDVHWMPFWNGLLALLVCLSGVAVPLQLAFDHAFAEAGLAWEIPSYFMDACFMLDIVVQVTDATRRLARPRLPPAPTPHRPPPACPSAPPPLRPDDVSLTCARPPLRVHSSARASCWRGRW